MNAKAVLITGGTGFLGSALTRRLLASGHKVTVFGRDAAKVSAMFGSTVDAATQISALPDAGQYKAVVNLAGAGIFDRLWTASRKQVLRDSRIELTNRLTNWIAESSQPPGALISGSAIGIYGDCGNQLLDESSSGPSDFAQQLCADWEAAAMRAEANGCRVCLIRTGLVLGNNGGILQRMLLPFRLGLGGRMGDGQQWMSWILIDDWLSIVETMIDNPDMAGAYNATAPNPVSNQTFSETLAGVLHRPLLLPLPAMALKLLLGEMASLVLGSQRVLPQRLLAGGFQFSQTQLEPALRQLLTHSG